MAHLWTPLFVLLSPNHQKCEFVNNLSSNWNYSVIIHEPCCQRLLGCHHFLHNGNRFSISPKFPHLHIIKRCVQSFSIVFAVRVKNIFHLHVFAKCETLVGNSRDSLYSFSFSIFIHCMRHLKANNSNEELFICFCNRSLHQQLCSFHFGSACTLLRRAVELD